MTDDFAGTGKKDTGYWRGLLAVGAVLTVVAAVCLAVYEHGTAQQVVLSGVQYSLSQRKGGWLDAALFFGAAGELFFLPGVIGWGIHASGLTRDPVPARQPSRLAAALDNDLAYMDDDGR
jgi:hypothetical protein